MTRSFPFHVLGVTTLPRNRGQSGDTSLPSLVAITHTWNVVMLGDNTKFTEEGAVAVGIRGAPVATKRTLFQNIFGTSALVDPSTLQRFSQNTPAQLSTWKGKDVEKIFDVPTYLMPSLDSLFDPLIQSFLTERPSDAYGVDDGGNIDEPMDADVEDEPILVGNRLERVVGEGEMATMVDLFKAHAIRRKRFISFPYSCPLMSALASKFAVNGMQHVNGVHKAGPQLNGISAKSKSAPSEKPSVSTTPQPTASPGPSTPASTVASPSVRIGQKRKKSLES